MNIAELAIHRKGTREFIAKDSTTLILIPTTKTEAFGTVEFSDQPPRAPQVFKFIYPLNVPIDTTPDGDVHKIDFILVGNHDAQIEIGDHWSEGEQFYVVEWVQPYNGYEVKAGGTSHGDRPDHG